MKQDTPPPTTTTATMKGERGESKSIGGASLSTTTPSRFRASPKAAKDPLPKPRKPSSGSVPKDTNNEIHSQQQKTKMISFILGNKPKSGELEEVKGVSRFGNRAAPADQFARPGRQRVAAELVNSRNWSEGDVDGKKKELLLQDKLDQSDTLIKNLQTEVMELKAELEKAHSLNLELQSHNQKLSQDFAAAEAKIVALSTRQQKKERVAENQSPRFKDIQKLISNKLEHSVVRREGGTETSSTKTPLAAPVGPVLGTTIVQRKVTEYPSSLPPPPPPPLPPQRLPAKESTNASAVVKLYQSVSRHDMNKNHPGGGNYSKSAVSSAHYSIVGEIQNRSAHVLAIKSDIETKGTFIEGLIQKVLDAAYTDIEDVLNFVDWLDKELSSLADERAVLKHFKWPEKKADAMQEAAIEYRSLKLLESEVSSYKYDTSVPCGVALKKMASLLDRSERSIQRLIKLRSSVMRSYKDHKIPTDWMLDLGIINKIKQASILLAKMYMERVMVELESIQYSERESTQEALLFQGVQFAYRAHQFSGGLDSETLCAFEAIKQRVPGHLQGSREHFTGLPSPLECTTISVFPSSPFRIMK